MENNCNNLDNSSDICKIGKCIESIKRNENISASLSEKWFINFKKGVKFNGEKLDKGFIKFFIDPSFFMNMIKNNKKYIKNINDAMIMLVSFFSLRYEILVYKDIIGPIVNNNISPNFVQYISSAIKCKNKDLLDLGIKKDILIKNIKKSMFINNENIDLTKIIDDFEYDFLITRPIKNSGYNTETFRDIITSEIMANFKLSNVVYFMKIYFQIILGCFIMSKAKLIHNDLHDQNILMEKYVNSKGNKNITYIINENVYNMEIDHIVKIFDFDRSYSPNLGNNQILDGSLSIQYSQRNVFVPNLDIIKISGYISEYLGQMSEYSKLAMNIITGWDDKLNKKLVDIWNRNMYLNDKNGMSLEAKFYKSFPSIDSILGNAIKYMKMKNIFNDIKSDPKDTYIFNDNMFVDGNLNINSIKNSQKNDEKNDEKYDEKNDDKYKYILEAIKLYEKSNEIEEKLEIEEILSTNNC